MHRWCQSLVAEGCGDDGAGVGPQMAMQGPLPEICQKLRYAQPHAAPLTNPRQHLPPARLCGNVRCCMAL